MLCKQLPIDQVQQNIFAFDKTNRIEKVSLCMIVIFFNLIDILFTRGKHLNDFAISLRNTNLTPELCILVPVSSQESEQSRICLMVIDFCIWFYEYSIGIWNCFDSVLFLFYDLSNCKYWLTLSVHVWVLVIFGKSNCMIWKGCVQTLYNFLPV